MPVPTDLALVLDHTVLPHLGSHCFDHALFPAPFWYAMLCSVSSDAMFQDSRLTCSTLLWEAPPLSVAEQGTIMLTCAMKKVYPTLIFFTLCCTKQSSQKSYAAGDHVCWIHQDLQWEHKYDGLVSLNISHESPAIVDLIFNLFLPFRPTSYLFANCWFLCKQWFFHASTQLSL